MFIEYNRISLLNIQYNTLKELIFAGTKFREYCGFWGHPRNLIPAKRKKLTIHEI